MTMTARPADAAAGAARSPGVRYQELLDADSRPENVPVTLRWQGNEHLGSTDIPRRRYVDRAYHELEKERLWRKVWQMACREEDIPDVGDTLVYDICDLSILVVRSAPGEIRAFFNACLHRGRQLKEGDGNNAELRCAFHGYCWNLDGSLKQIPCEWDFPHVDRAEWDLPAVQVGTWQGFVFVNPDPGRRAAGVVRRRSRGPLRQVAARPAAQVGARGEGLPGQLEGRAGGVHGGLPRGRHPSPAARRHR
jgi:nitrite reductase/ring-hydroxylating ferredoxin subunit